jgi:hypothetical protein
VDGGRNLRSFVLGGIVGSVAGLAAAGRMKVRQAQRRTTPVGLAAFERAPCYNELLERETREMREARGDVR